MVATSAVCVITNRLKQWLLPAFLLILTYTAMWAGMPQALAKNRDKETTVRPVAILTLDDLGKSLKYPSALFYDKGMEELYVVSGGSGRIVVYGPNNFPTASLGRDRGLDSPQGVFIDDSGLIYVCQGRSRERSPRISIYNAAFFPVRQITFPSTEEEFIPRSMAIGAGGRIYVAGYDSLGVMVLDRNGRFMHWLRPVDLVARGTQKEEGVEEGKEEGNRAPDRPSTDGPVKEDDEENFMAELLPPELLPKQEKQREDARKGREMLPVQVIDVKTDSQGHIYVLSQETSKIYVYGPNEKLLFSFGQKGGSSGKMSRPRSLVIDEKRKSIFVADYMRHTILIFDQGGRFIDEFGGMGYGPGWFRFPSYLSLDAKGRLIVADLFNQRVQILDVKFQYQFPIFQGGVEGK